MTERVSDEDLAQAADESFGLSTPMLVKVARELIDRRKAAKYVQHLPGCSMICNRCKGEGGHYYIAGNRTVKCSDCKGTGKKPCTCGLSELPEYVRFGE